MNDARARVNLALSILNNAATLGYEQAADEAVFTLRGASLDELLAIRADWDHSKDAAAYHARLAHGTVCTICEAVVLRALWGA